jgi:hypothetical protein
MFALGQRSKSSWKMYVSREKQVAFDSSLHNLLYWFSGLEFMIEDFNVLICRIFFNFVRFFFISSVYLFSERWEPCTHNKFIILMFNFLRKSFLVSHDKMCKFSYKIFFYITWSLVLKKSDKFESKESRMCQSRRITFILKISSSKLLVNL